MEECKGGRLRNDEGTDTPNTKLIICYFTCNERHYDDPSPMDSRGRNACLPLARPHPVNPCLPVLLLFFDSAFARLCRPHPCEGSVDTDTFRIDETEDQSLDGPKQIGWLSQTNS